MHAHTHIHSLRIFNLFKCVHFCIYSSLLIAHRKLVDEPAKSFCVCRKEKIIPVLSCADYKEIQICTVEQCWFCPQELSGTFHCTFIPKDSHRHFLSVCVFLSNVGAQRSPQRSPQRLSLPLQALNLVEEIHFPVLTDSNICMTACNESRFSAEDLLLA